MIKTIPKFNSSLTFLIAIINTILLFTFLIELDDSENQILFYFNIFWFVIAVQFGLIAYFDTSENKKAYKVFSIITLIIALIVTVILAYLTGLASAFQH